MLPLPIPFRWYVASSHTVLFLRKEGLEQFFFQYGEIAVPSLVLRRDASLLAEVGKSRNCSISGFAQAL